MYVKYIQYPVDEKLRYESDFYLDLDVLIIQNYDRKTKTLDLRGAVKGGDFIKVLERIKQNGLSFFNQIERLVLSGNEFKHVFNPDEVRLPEFPSTLKTLDLSGNQLSGSAFPWNKLPMSLENLYLQNNRLDGIVLWKLLPKRLKVLWIFGNQIQGPIEWNKLPEDMNILGVPKGMTDGPRTPTNMWIKEKAEDPIKKFYTKYTVLVESVDPHCHIGRIHRGIQETPFMPTRYWAKY